MPQKVILVPGGGPICFNADAQGNPVPKNARLLHIIAKPTLDGLDPSTVNASAVAIGHSKNSEEQPLALAPGDERIYIAPAGMMFDLSRWYLNGANTGDGIVIIYE